MLGYRFYSDFASAKDKRLNNHRGSVVAVLLDVHGRPLYSSSGETMDAIVGVHDWPNSGVATSGVSREYLRKRCKQVPEKLAREIHPVLFNVLDNAKPIGAK